MRHSTGKPKDDGTELQTFYTSNGPEYDAATDTYKTPPRTYGTAGATATSSGTLADDGTEQGFTRTRAVGGAGTGEALHSPEGTCHIFIIILGTLCRIRYC